MDKSDVKDIVSASWTINDACLRGLTPHTSSPYSSRGSSAKPQNRSLSTRPSSVVCVSGAHQELVVSPLLSAFLLTPRPGCSPPFTSCRKV